MESAFFSLDLISKRLVIHLRSNLRAIANFDFEIPKLHRLHHLHRRGKQGPSSTKSRSVQDFYNYATRVLGKYETVDAYYRHNSSTNFVGNVMVPLLCISALDDPVCTREAIPWDECSM